MKTASDAKLRNSGLGFAICLRLVDEFVCSGLPDRRLHLVVTTRTRSKGDLTVSRLKRHIKKKHDAHSSRVLLRLENVDLTVLRSVRALSKKLRDELPRLDAVILNAGSGGFTGLNWPQAIWAVMTDLVHAVTWPAYKRASIGSLTARQTSRGTCKTEGGTVDATPSLESTPFQEPPLAEIFCANVFAHYLLSHDLAPLLKASAGRGPSATAGRVIWISSLESDLGGLQVSDVQGLRSRVAYEHSKRLTDVLALTSALPSTQPWVEAWLEERLVRAGGGDALPKARVYLAHPGVCATSIVPLHAIVSYAMIIVLYLARWLGSPWHTVTAYSGACAPVWLALTPQAELDRMEDDGGPGKWGSATDLWGRDRVMRTEVDGWGLGGRIDRGGVPVSPRRPGSRRGAVDLTEDALQDFEDLGRGCWREMEDLREVWEGIM